MKTKITQDHFRFLFSAMFVFYLIILVKIILLRDTSLTSLPEHFSDGYQGFRSLNLIPFQTFRVFASMMSSESFLWAVSNIAGNALIFLPYGYLLSLLGKENLSTWKILFSAGILSLLFETLQYCFYLGSADIDDLILNILGAFLGILCYRLISAISRQRRLPIYKISMILSILAFLGAFAVGYFEFGNRLGLANYQEENIGGEKIPDREPDFNGYFTSGSDAKITAQNSLDDTYAEQTDFPITADTTIYYLESASDRLNPNKVINTYKLYSTSQLASVKKHSRVTIWYSKNSDAHTAEVIVLSDLEEQAQEGTITFGAEDSHRLTGYLTKTGDGQCTINKIDSYELKDGSTVSSSTSLEIPMHYEKEIPITVRDVYENGNSYKDRQGNLQDLKKDVFVTAEGNYKNKIFYAEKLTIQIFH